MPVLCRLVLICRIPYEIINKYRFYGRMISAPTQITERAQFSQRSITRNYALAPKLRTGEPIAEFWVRQGVRFCTRGSVRRCVTERAWFSQRSITRNYALAPKLRTGEPIAEFGVRQGVGFCTRGSVCRYVTERAQFPQRSITRNYALAIFERLSLSIAIFSFSFLAASR